MSAYGFDAVVFDLDGTLVDSIPDVIGAMNRVLTEHGRRAITLDEGRTMVGEGAAALIQRAFAATGAPPQSAAVDILVRRYLEWYRQFPAAESTVFPGVAETLRELRAAGVALGVCTNKPHEMVAPVLDGLGLSGFFTSALGAGALSVRKPDPAHMHAVIEAIGGARDSAAYVGDGPTDCEAARAANLPIVLVTYGYTRVPVRELKADAYIDRFADLPDALRTLARETVRG